MTDDHGQIDCADENPFGRNAFIEKVVSRLPTFVTICGLWLGCVVVFLLYAGWIPRTPGGWLFAIFLGPIAAVVGEVLFGLLFMLAMAFPPTRAFANWVRADGTSEQQWPRVIAILAIVCLIIFIFIQIYRL